MKPLHELILPLDFNSSADFVQPVKMQQFYIKTCVAILVVIITPLTYDIMVNLVSIHVKNTVNALDHSLIKLEMAKVFPVDLWKNTNNLR